MSDQNTETSEQADSPDGAAKLVPVAESIKYRRRAQQAETRIQELEQGLKELQTQLDGRRDELATAEAQRDEAQHQLEATENRFVAERMLADAGVVDLETAGMLLSQRANLSGPIDRESLAGTIEQLLLDKPFLRDTAGAQLPPASAAARPHDLSPAALLARAAQQAAHSGDRKDVAEYLRLRRRASMTGS